MRVAIIGSRLFTDYKFLKDQCNAILKDTEVTCFIFGGAKGADTLGEQYREEMYPKASYIRHSAEWGNLNAKPCVAKIRKDGTPYNALAGMNRNTYIAEDADIVIAFLTGESKGTKDTIGKAKARRKYVYVVDKEESVLWVSKNGEKWEKKEI